MEADILVLNKMLNEGLLMDTEDGYRQPQEYDVLSITCQEDVGNDVGYSKNNRARRSHPQRQCFHPSRRKKNKGIWVVLK